MVVPNKTSRFALVTIAAILVVVSTLSPLIHLQADSNKPKLLPMKSRIGAVEAFFRPKEAADAQLGSERIIFEWRNFQPNGPDDWNINSIAGEWLEDANRNGRVVVGLIKNAPKWATGSDLVGAPPLGLDLPLDDPNNHWAAFISKLTQFYSTQFGGIHHWIIYNEPDIRPNAEATNFFEFYGDIQDYYQVLKVAYKVAHATDPQAVIHLAGFTYWHDIQAERVLYLERLLHIIASDPEAKENNQFFDVLSVHAFVGPDWVWYITRRYLNLVARYGYSKPLWINELNVLLTQDEGYPVAQIWPKTTLDQQANFIIQGTAIGLAAGADQVQVYKLFDNDMREGYEAWGMIRGDGTHRPSYYALRTASKLFGNATSAQRTRNSFAQMVTLTTPAQTVYVMWNKRRIPVVLKVRATRSIAPVQIVSKVGKVVLLPKSESLDGEYIFTLPPCTGTCDVQGEPIILLQPGAPQPAWVISNQAPPNPLVRFEKE
jgi:hypothetical protein